MMLLGIEVMLQRAQGRLDSIFRPPPRTRKYHPDLLSCFDLLLEDSRSQLHRFNKEAFDCGLFHEIEQTLSWNLGNEFGGTALENQGWKGVLAAIYALVRTARPQRVVETGVGIVGATTSTILDALESNGSGELWSIDPDWFYRAAGIHVGAGIPSRLRHRLHLNVGRSGDLLVPLLRESHDVDLFIHDGGHTFRNMLFEFRSVWPHLRPGGILLSDDINNHAFDTFSREVGVEMLAASYGTSFVGLMRRPTTMRQEPLTSPS